MKAKNIDVFDYIKVNGEDAHDLWKYMKWSFNNKQDEKYIYIYLIFTYTFNVDKGAFKYYVSTWGEGVYRLLTFSNKGEGGLKRPIIC